MCELHNIAFACTGTRTVSAREQQILFRTVLCVVRARFTCTDRAGWCARNDASRMLLVPGGTVCGGVEDGCISSTVDEQWHAVTTPAAPHKLATAAAVIDSASAVGCPAATSVFISRFVAVRRHVAATAISATVAMWTYGTHVTVG